MYSVQNVGEEECVLISDVNESSFSTLSHSLSNLFLNSDNTEDAKSGRK